IPGFRFPPESRSFQLGRQGIVWMHLDREPVSGIEQLDQQREDRALAVGNRLSEYLGWRGGDGFRERLPEKWATADRALITDEPGLAIGRGVTPKPGTAPNPLFQDWLDQEWRQTHDRLDEGSSSTLRTAGAGCLGESVSGDVNCHQ